MNSSIELKLNLMVRFFFIKHVSQKSYPKMSRRISCPEKLFNIFRSSSRLKSDRNTGKFEKRSSLCYKTNNAFVLVNSNCITFKERFRAKIVEFKTRRKNAGRFLSLMLRKMMKIQTSKQAYDYKVL